MFSVDMSLLECMDHSGLDASQPVDTSAVRGHHSTINMDLRFARVPSFILTIHSFFIRTSNFGAEAERS